MGQTKAAAGCIGKHVWRRRKARRRLGKGVGTQDVAGLSPVVHRKMRMQDVRQAMPQVKFASNWHVSVQCLKLRASTALCWLPAAFQSSLVQKQTVCAGCASGMGKDVPQHGVLRLAAQAQAGARPHLQAGAGDLQTVCSPSRRVPSTGAPTWLDATERAGSVRPGSGPARQQWVCPPGPSALPAWGRWDGVAHLRACPLLQAAPVQQDLAGGVHVLAHGEQGGGGAHTWDHPCPRLAFGRPTRACQERVGGHRSVQGVERRSTLR